MCFVVDNLRKWILGWLDGNAVADVGLGHVDADGGSAQGAGVCGSGSLENLPLWLLRAQHELLLPGHLLQITFLQHTAHRESC